MQEGGKVYETGVQSPANNADIMQAPDVFNAAREAATRIGADIVVAGRLNTRKAETKDVLYDQIATFETTVELVVVRATDGARLAGTKVVERASDKDAALARDKAIASAVKVATARVYGETKPQWRKLYMGDNTFEVMFSNVIPPEVESLSRHLEQKLGKGSKASLRSFYGNVAILGLDTPRQYAALQRALLDYRELNLRVTDRQGKRVTVEVRH